MAVVVVVHHVDVEEIDCSVVDVVVDRNVVAVVVQDVVDRNVVVVVVDHIVDVVMVDRNAMEDGHLKNFLDLYSKNIIEIDDFGRMALDFVVVVVVDHNDVDVVVVDRNVDVVIVDHIAIEDGH